MGFHAGQESARILAEALEAARQARGRALAMPGPPLQPVKVPDAPVRGVTPTESAPPGQA